MASDTTTGAAALYIRNGPERDEILGLIRIGIQFKRQHVGRRPGFLHRYIVDLVAQMPKPVTFAALLSELDLAAGRRAASDGWGEPIERVSRSFEELTYHDPKRGRQKIAFGTVMNYFTKAKKARFPASP